MFTQISYLLFMKEFIPWKTPLLLLVYLNAIHLLSKFR
jgi:hypothetical protein